jgi:lysophospholipase L1-like esterase
MALGKVAQAGRYVPDFSAQPSAALVPPLLYARAGAPATAHPAVLPLAVTPNTTIQGPLLADPAMFYGSVAHAVDSSGLVASIQPHGTTGPSAFMEWVTDSPLFALVGTFGLSSFYLWIDGELAYGQGSGSPFDNGYGYIDWSGVRQMRHYRLMAGNGLKVSGFAADKADTFYAPTGRRQISFGYLGDSYSQGYLPWQIGQLLGWTMPAVSSDGGTGYITAGSGQPFTARVPDIIAAKPDVVVLAGGINDPITGFQTGATQVLSQLRAGLPGAPIFVISPWCPPGSPYSSQTDKYTALKAATADTAGAVFIDTHTWITGTGNTGNLTGDGNADIYINTDNTHPNPAGFLYLAGRIASAILATLPY